MSRFRALGGGRFETLDPLVVQVGNPGASLAVIVPPNFAFDVSVPRPLRWLFNPNDPRFRRAAAVHDYVLGLGWPREAAAAPFGHALRAAGVGRAKRLAMVLGVIVWNWR